jgi:hypothetical protein
VLSYIEKLYLMDDKSLQDYVDTIPPELLSQVNFTIVHFFSPFLFIIEIEISFYLGFSLILRNTSIHF